jgi:hypothetical protein
MAPDMSSANELDDRTRTNEAAAAALATDRTDAFRSRLYAQRRGNQARVRGRDSNPTWEPGLVPAYLRPGAVVATVRHGRTDEQVRDAVAERYTDGIWGGASAASQTVGIADVSGCRVQRHVVWLLTLEELRRLLLSDFLWPSVKQLTGLQKADVASRVEELREIRNVIGHNRATTGQTARIFEGIEGYLGSGVERFRQESGSDRGGSSDFPRVRPPARTRTRRALPRRALLRPRLRRAPV